MQSLEHRVLAQTARTQFKERHQSMARFHPSHRPPGSYPKTGAMSGLATTRELPVHRHIPGNSSVQ